MPSKPSYIIQPRQEWGQLVVFPLLPPPQILNLGAAACNYRILRPIFTSSLRLGRANNAIIIP